MHVVNKADMHAIGDVRHADRYAAKWLRTAARDLTSPPSYSLQRLQEKSTQFRSLVSRLLSPGDLVGTLRVSSNVRLCGYVDPLCRSLSFEGVQPAAVQKISQRVPPRRLVAQLSVHREPLQLRIVAALVRRRAVPLPHAIPFVPIYLCWGSTRPPPVSSAPQLGGSEPGMAVL